MRSTARIGLADLVTGTRLPILYRNVVPSDSYRFVQSFAMTVRHNFYLFFGVSYFVLLAVGVSAGLAFGNLTGLNAGPLVNLVCFAAAVQISTTRFGTRFLYVEGLSSIGLRAAIRKRRFLLPVAYASIAVGIDMVFYTFSSFFFLGEFRDLNPWRLLAMAAVYGGLSYAALTWLDREKKGDG